MYKIYCDMDGVLVDFIGALNKLGFDINDLNDRPDEVWPEIDKASFGFWSRAEWMKDGKMLWDYIKVYKPEILSSPSRDMSSRIGKKMWVARELGNNVIVNLIYKKQKQKFADSNHILIDDHPGNIKRWINAGGIGIHHVNSINTIKELKQLGV